MRSYTRLIWLAVAIWVVGAIPLGFATYAGVRAIFAPLDRFVAPGSVRERLDARQERVVLIQTAGDRDARLGDRKARDVDLRCVVRGAGATVRPHRIREYTVTRNRDAYVAELAFKAPRTGDYRIACDPPRPMPLAVSRRADLDLILGYGFFALALCAGAIMAGVAIARSARRLGPEAPAATRP